MVKLFSSWLSSLTNLRQCLFKQYAKNTQCQKYTKNRTQSVPRLKGNNSGSPEGCVRLKTVKRLPNATETLWNFWTCEVLGSFSVSSFSTVHWYLLSALCSSSSHERNTWVLNHTDICEQLPKRILYGSFTIEHAIEGIKGEFVLLAHTSLKSPTQVT